MIIPFWKIKTVSYLIFRRNRFFFFLGGGGGGGGAGRGWWECLRLRRKFSHSKQVTVFKRHHCACLQRVK